MDLVHKNQKILKQNKKCLQIDCVCVIIAFANFIGLPINIFGGYKMGFWEILLGILMIVVSLIIIAIILLQQGHRAGVNGAISGGADTFLSKNKARTVNAKLARMTKYIAIAFFVLAIVANIISLNK